MPGMMRPISQKPAGHGNYQGLNAAQIEAVQTVQGPLLVLAGAGTGKTRVITCRMAELIRNGVVPNRILSVTFTNKAAKEMQERTSAQLGRRVNPKPYISTFHSYCVDVLRKHIDRLGYPKNFTIFDRGDQESAARRSLRDIKVPDTALKHDKLLMYISNWKMNGVLPQQAMHAEAEDDLGYLAAMAYRRYQMALKATGAVDFDDLLLLTTQLFDEHPDVLDFEQNRFDFVQIDEYQDTNAMQFRIVEGLVEQHKNICVVGDDDQSIYGWRGAEIKHILEFPARFPGTKVVRLEENYRCAPEIIATANRLVACNLGRHRKQLRATRPDHPAVTYREFPDELTEALGVVRDIKYLITQMDVPAKDIAILFRTNEQPRVFESELRRQQVPYTLVGSQSFYDRKETRDLTAFLKVLANPRDRESLLRIINVPPRGIGEAAVEKVLTRSVKTNKNFWDCVPELAEAGELSARTAKAMVDFHEHLDRLRRQFQAGSMKLSEAFGELVKSVNYEEEIGRHYKNPEQQQNRKMAIDEYELAMREYEQSANQVSLMGFLDASSLSGDPSRFVQDNEDFDRPTVKMMTLHSAKGLEFPRVYLVGLEEGLLPHRRSIDDGSTTAIEEERRLAYVGVTRARDHLFVSRSTTRTKYGKKKDSKPSRFWMEMQNEE